MSRSQSDLLEEIASLEARLRTLRLEAGVSPPAADIPRASIGARFADTSSGWATHCSRLREDRLFRRHLLKPVVRVLDGRSQVPFSESCTHTPKYLGSFWQ